MPGKPAGRGQEEYCRGNPFESLYFFRTRTQASTAVPLAKACLKPGSARQLQDVEAGRSHFRKIIGQYMQPTIAASILLLNEVSFLCHQRFPNSASVKGM